MPSEDQKEKIREGSRSYLKYSGLAFQLLGIVAILFFVGRYLDKKLGLEQPIIAMLLIIVTFSAYMYKLYKELFNNK